MPTRPVLRKRHRYLVPEPLEQLTFGPFQSRYMLSDKLPTIHLLSLPTGPIQARVANGSDAIATSTAPTKSIWTAP